MPRGRKPLIEELRVRNLAIAAVEHVYGDLRAGLVALLESGETPLIKFVFEHAYGKPTENVNIDSNQRIESIQIIQLPDNGRDPEMIYQVTDMPQIADAEVIQSQTNYAAD